MVGAAEAELLEQAIGGAGEVAVGEEQQVLGLPHLLFTQEEWLAPAWPLVRAASRAIIAWARHGSHPQELGQEC